MCDVMYTMQYVKTTVWYRNDLSGKSLGRRVSMIMYFQAFARKKNISLIFQIGIYFKKWGHIFCAFFETKIKVF